MGFYDSMIKGLAGFFCALYRVELIGAENIPEDTERSGLPGFMLCSNHIADIGSLIVRENENEFTVRVDFSTSYTNALLTLDTLFTLRTSFTLWTLCNNAQILITIPPVAVFSDIQIYRRTRSDK